jgi:tetratricopeptide (TPR) repeat protein
MSRITSHALSGLAHLPETWQIAIAQLRLWLTPPDQEPSRPYLVLIVSLEQGTIRASQIIKSQPQRRDVHDVLLQAMARPVPGGGRKGVPRTILVPDSKVADALSAFLAETQLRIDIVERQPSEQVAQIIQDLEDHLRGGPEQPAMLSVAGVTQKLAAAFFAAAAEFYRAAPWVRLDNFQVLALRHPAESKYRYTIVMGQAGIEYGLATYLNWEDVEELYTSEKGPMEAIPARGAHSLSYEAVQWMPFGDFEMLQESEWVVAAENAYPVAVVFERGGRVRRPAPIDLLWYEAALRAIPILLRDYLKPDGRGDYQPLETEIEVPTHTGSVRMAVRYPAGQTPLAEQPAQRMSWPELEDEKEGEDAPPSFDRRQMERVMQGVARQIGAEVGPGDADLDRAQELMYQAFEEANPAKRIALAHDALAISPDCADAYVLLAEEEADTVGRALELYQEGVAAGTKALGKSFNEHAGSFWGILETRPYMRARRGLADTLWRVGRKEEALAHYRELLHLNPADNQGNRYVLLDLLLQMDRMEEVTQLLEQYRDDWTAAWLYTGALVKFRQHGASKEAEKALGNALEENPHVPAYLTGQKRIPNRLPEYIGWGDEQEGMVYAADHLNHWRRTPGAVEWLGGRAQVSRLKHGAKGQRNRGSKKR